MLKVENIDCKYDRLQVLWNVNLHVDAGELVCLIGANGVGKTTLMKAISGLERPVCGRVIFQGEDITGLSPSNIVKRGVVQVAEGRQLFSSMTVRENLELGAYIWRKSGKESVYKQMKHVFDLFPVLDERKNQIVGTLSGGQQQMLAIGRALMSRPKILLMDEPSLGLSPVLVQKTFGIIKEIRLEGIAILLVEQNAVASLEISDRAYVMDTGKIVLEGKGSDLLNDSRVKIAYLAG